MPFARAATRSLYRPLLAAGVSIHEWNGSVLLAKVASVDGRLLLVGSFDLDPLSLANQETLVEVADAEIVGRTEAWTHDHFARSRAVTSLEACSLSQRWLLDPFGRLAAQAAGAVGRIIASRKRRRAARDYSLSSPASHPLLEAGARTRSCAPSARDRTAPGSAAPSLVICAREARSRPWRGNCSH